MKSLNRSLKRLVRKLGYDVTRYQPRTHPTSKKYALTKDLGIDLVLDVGANVGMFARDLKNSGYTGRLISFEPLSKAYAALERKAKADSNWQTINMALGSEDCEQTINISDTDTSSSLLEATSLAMAAHPQTRKVSTELIQVRKLDSIFDSLNAKGSNIWLKVDTQGYEMEVLRGAERSLESVSLLQLEMAFLPLYDGQTLFSELYEWVQDHGFRLGSFESMSWHPQTGDLLWLDGIFHRSQSVA